MPHVVRSQDASAATAGWSLPGDRSHSAESGHSAESRLNGGVVAIDLDDPRRGISCPPDRLLGLELRSQPRLVEHWLRGGDVTAVYEPADARRLRATAMWRLCPAVAPTAGREPPVTGWELIVSAQTSLEESDSCLAVVSDVEAVEVLCGQAGDGRDESLHWMPEPSAATTCVLLRRPAASAAGDAGATSVLVAVHPADLRRLRVRRQGGRVGVECWIFSSAVEKGVLLRGRVLAAVGPAGGDTDWAAAVSGQFSASPPFLST